MSRIDEMRAREQAATPGPWRKDVNGNYEPSNCQWTTLMRQENNRTNNLLLTIDERTETLADWCREYDIEYNMVQKRLKRGWCIEAALTVPSLANKGRLTFGIDWSGAS